MNALLLIATFIGATTNYYHSDQQALEAAALLTAKPVNVACVNASETDDPTCASFELNTKGFVRVTLFISYTNSTATRLDLRASGNPDGAAPWYEIQGGSPAAAPVIAMGPNALYWSTTDADWPASTETRSYLVTFLVNSPMMRFRLWATGGAVGDIVSVKVIKSGR